MESQALKQEIETALLNFTVNQSLQIREHLTRLHQIEPPQQLTLYYIQFLKCCREHLHSKLKSPQSQILTDDIQELLRVNIFLTEMSYRKCREHADCKHYPLVFCEDVYDCLSLVELTEYFSNLQSQVATLQQFPELDKFVLLKICNAILKRLSTTHETELRGKIHIFLTQIFATLHKSGSRKHVNLKDRGFEEEGVIPNNQLPYSFYKNFWSLQKYLNNVDQMVKNKVVDYEEDEVPKSAVSIAEPLRVKNLQAISKVITRTLMYFRENQVQPRNDCTKRFPKFLTKYSLFKDQLNDPSFRRVFLNQILLFVFALENDQLSKEEKLLITPLKTEVLRQFDQHGEQMSVKVTNLIETEKVWPIWMREQFDNSTESLSMKAVEKAQLKKQEIMKRIFDDQKLRETSQFGDIIKEQREFKIDTSPIEPGLNFYINDVLPQMESTCRVSDSERYRNMKDYSWKSVRVIAKFFLRELKITNLISNDKPLPNLEEITEVVRKAGMQIEASKVMMIKPAII